MRLKIRVDSRQLASALALRKPGMSMWLGHLFWHGGRQYALWSEKISSRFVRRSRRISSVWVWTTMPSSAWREHEIGGVLLALDLDHAHPAGAEARQLGLVAQGRDLDAVVAADLEDRLALEALHEPPVDLDPDRRRALGPLRGLGGDQPLGEPVVLRRDRVEHRGVVGARLDTTLGRAFGADDQVGHVAS